MSITPEFVDPIVNDNGFSNIIMYIGEGSIFYIGKRYTHCTFIFSDMSAESIHKIIEQIDAINCEFIMHDPVVEVGIEFDAEMLWDNKGAFKRMNCQFIDVKKRVVKHNVKNVSKLRIKTLTEG